MPAKSTRWTLTTSAIESLHNLVEQTIFTHDVDQLLRLVAETRKNRIDELNSFKTGEAHNAAR